MSIFKKWAGRILFNNSISLYDKEIGSIDGFVVKYKTTTSVDIIAGIIEANGKYYKLTSDLTYAMTSLASAFDFHYIYIDDDASVGSTPTIIDSTTEPTYSITKKGWYNGNDRCIGVISSPNGSSIISTFETEITNQKSIKYYVPLSNMPQMASDMNPNNTWQTPDDNNGSDITPVNSNLLRLKLKNSDLGAFSNIYAVSKEFGDIQTSISDSPFSDESFSNSLFNHWIPLGNSRDIYVGGTDDDDNNLNAWCIGYNCLR